MIAAKWGDPVAGVDVHLVMVPTPAGPVPTPLPHPFVGVVFDPLGAAIGAAIGLALGSGGPVLVNGLPTGNTGTGVRGVPHIPTPPGVSPAPGDAPTGNEGTLVTGSKTVHFGGSSESRTTSLVSSCSFPVNLPTSVCLAVPAGPPVLIGGPEALDVLAAILAGIRTKWVSDKLHALLGVKSGSLLSKVICFLTGHPVDVMSGELLADAVDFKIPGMIPIIWERNYRSRRTREGGLGAAWTHPFEDCVEPSDGGTRVWLADGRPRDLPPLALGERHWDGQDRFTLERTRSAYVLRTWDGFRRTYGKVAESSVYVLLEVRDRAGNSIAFSYERGYLTNVRDTAGRDLAVRWTSEGRIDGVYFDGEPLVRYHYTLDQRLAAASDRLGHAMRYAYDGGVLVEETHKGGLVFHFEWDYPHAEGWCVRTWGEDPTAALAADSYGVPRYIYDRRIKYDPTRHFTAVEDGRGGITQYWGDGTGLVVRERRPGLLACIEYTWSTHFQKTSETDGEDNKTEWTYDAQGNCVYERNALGFERRRRFDSENCLVEYTDEAGARWVLSPHPNGRFASIQNPLGVASLYAYDEYGRVLKITDPMGRTEAYTWDSNHNLSRHVDGAGHATHFTHDELGRVLTVTDASGRVARFERDVCGRIVRLNRADGERLENRYDSEGNLVEQLDSQGRRAQMSYAGRHKLVSHVDAAGHRIRFVYDAEEELLAVENQIGEQYRFERDSGGRVSCEIGFDGRKRKYFYDNAERLTRIVAPDATVVLLERDALGRVVKEICKAPPSANSDPGALERAEETHFEFSRRGEVVAALSTNAKVWFERDDVGRILREVSEASDGTRRSVHSRYDYSGLRVERETDLGHRARYSWNGAGQLTEMRAGISPRLLTPEVARLGVPLLSLPEWELTITRDVLGREAERHMPGGVTTKWSRDKNARPLACELTAHGSGEQFASLRAVTRYTWSGPNELAAVADSENGLTRDEHDARGHLVASVLPDGTVKHRASDAVSNIYRAPDLSDRVYGRGGRLERAGGTEYRYDDNGYLVEKVLSDGARWKYFWTANGRLAAVERPDRRRVAFSYDAFGRRVRKTFDGIVTEYVWDGDDLVHERSTSRRDSTPLVTWLFAPHTSTVAAKFVGRDRFSVVLDHIGKPTSLLAEDGQVVWRARAGFGEDSPERADDGGVNPWRYPGQYADSETGLVYNRFRYYDPEADRYISQDPVGLRGGLPQYSYVFDPLVAIDPLGLSGGCPAVERDPWHPDEVEKRIAAAAHDNGPLAAKAAEWEKTNYRSHGQPVYTDGQKYWTPDADRHNGGAWKGGDSPKAVGSKQTRSGTYDREGTRVGD